MIALYHTAPRPGGRTATLLEARHPALAGLEAVTFRSCFAHHTGQVLRGRFRSEAESRRYRSCYGRDVAVRLDGERKVTRYGVWAMGRARA